MSTCYAVDFAWGPVAWRCSRPTGHYPETPHGFEAHNLTYHEWFDEEDR